MIYAPPTNYTVHADDMGEAGTGSLTFEYTLVNQAGDTLVNQAGYELSVNQTTTVYGQVIHVPATDYTVHAED